ncbi:MAG: SPFH domain-containing protein [Spirochaetes bacterium]|nr:SPFH domain-containing protein [Spirochaetota bacterium]
MTTNNQKQQTGHIKNRSSKKTVTYSLMIRLFILLIFFTIGYGLMTLSGFSPTHLYGALCVSLPSILGLILVTSIRIADEWERAIILRLGKFNSVKGPGFFLIIPFVDRIAHTVDLRIRVSDFTAETTLTKDSVTVTVDALCFWMIWDAEKAVCEVQDYEEAVVLSAKTALRSAVSTHDLSTFLAQNNMIEECIRNSVDKKTTDWGITVQHIEITDIQIPEQLQDSLSRMAQAEREKNGRIFLAEAETQIAEIYKKSAKIYDTSPGALTLKNLSILNEGLKAGNSMMLVPNSITEKLGSDGILGLQALHNSNKLEKKIDTKNNDSTATKGEK